MDRTIRTHEELLDFYRQQTTTSAPGACEPLYDDLPADIPSLARVLHGILIHMWWISEQNYGLTLGDLKAAGRDILGEISLATTEEMLERIIELDPRPLNQRRDPNARLVGNCRDYSLLLVSILRSRGIPARARTGAATYFVQDKPDFEDHWICEYWNTEDVRWQQVDAQIDGVMRATMNLRCDPTDLPPGAFLTGWQCYDALSSGRVKPAQLGYGPDFNGMQYVRQKLLADLASVTGQEILPWAAWGIGTGGTTSDSDKQITEQIADILRQIDDPVGLEQARSLIATHPRVKRPEGYSAGRFQEAWL